jgi:N-acetylmuramoyl-L-alanine amidase
MNRLLQPVLFLVATGTLPWLGECIITRLATNTMQRFHYVPRRIQPVRKIRMYLLGILFVLGVTVAGAGLTYVRSHAPNDSVSKDVEWSAPAKKKKKQFHPSRISANDLKLMANAVYGEARGEPYLGQVAIAAVILNRVESPSFPDTPAAVIFEPGAFTAVADGQIWLTPNEKAKKAVRDSLSGWDPTGGCLYYFNPATATSKWIWSRPQVKRIGKHIFCR